MRALPPSTASVANCLEKTRSQKPLVDTNGVVHTPKNWEPFAIGNPPIGGFPRQVWRDTKYDQLIFNNMASSIKGSPLPPSITLLGPDVPDMASPPRIPFPLTKEAYTKLHRGGNQMRRHLHGLSLKGLVQRDELYRPARGSKNSDGVARFNENWASLLQHVEAEKTWRQEQKGRREITKRQKATGHFQESFPEEKGALFPKNHPLALLKYVSKSELRNNLLALRAFPECDQLIHDFTTAIRSDNWEEQEILSHRYMGGKFPDAEVPPLIENLALLAYQAGGEKPLLKGELEAFFEWANAKEQFGDEKASLYRTKHPVKADVMEAIGRNSHLKRKKKELVAAIKSGEWDHPVFNENHFQTKTCPEIRLQDLLVSAKRDGQLKPEEFNHAFTWIDAKNDHLFSNEKSGYEDAAPLIFPEPDPSRLGTLAPHLKDAQAQKIGAALRAAINSGDLKSDIFDRRYLRKSNPALAEKISMKDIAQAEKQSGRMNSDVYQATMLWLNLREQYGQKLFKFASASSGATEGVWVSLPQTVASVKMHRLFDKKGQLTPEGKEYLEKISGALSNPGDWGGYEYDANAFLQRLKELPPSLQMFFKIDDLNASDVVRKAALKKFLANIRNRLVTVLCNGYKYKNETTNKQDWNKLEPIFASSAGIAREFNRLFWISKTKSGSLLPPDEKTLVAQRVFGRQSEETRDWETMNGAHISLSYHPDVADNLVLVHGGKIGAFLGPRHDGDFHTPVGNMHSPSVRTGLSQVLTNFILEEVRAENENQDALARELAGAMGDLDGIIGEGLSVESEVAEHCLKKLSDFDKTSLNEIGYQTAQMERLSFFLKLLKNLENKGDGFPAPYGMARGKPSKSGEKVNLENYKPVISGNWSRLRRYVVKAIVDRMELMINKKIRLTPEAKKLAVELYDYGAFRKESGVFARYAADLKNKSKSTRSLMHSFFSRRSAP